MIFANWNNWKGMAIMLKLNQLEITDKVYYNWKGDCSINSNIMEDQRTVTQFQDWEKEGFIEVHEVFKEDDYKC